MLRLAVLVALVPLILTAGRRCAPGPVLPPADDFVLVNSRTGIQWTTEASTITQFASGTVWGGSGAPNEVEFSMLYRNAIISSGADFGSLSVIETRDYSSTTKIPEWFDAVGNWTSNGTDCTATFPIGLESGLGAHDSSYAIGSPLRAARVDLAFTLSTNYDGHPSGFNKLMWLYPNDLARGYVDLHGSGAGPYALNYNVQGTVNPGTTNWSPNIVPGASIERGAAVTLRLDLLGNTNGQADGEMHLYYKAA